MAARVSEVLLFFLLALLAGCATDPGCPEIPGGPHYCLRSTTVVPAHVSLQDVRIQVAGIDERLITQLEVDDQGMRLVGLTPMGQRVLDAHYDNQIARSTVLPGVPFDARALLSLVQLATWPADEVRAGLGENVKLEETAALRFVAEDAAIIFEVARKGDPPIYQQLEIRLPGSGLRLTVRAVNDDE